LSVSITNMFETLMQLRDWDAAEAELIQALDSDALADAEHLTWARGWLAALRGDAVSARAMLAGLQDLDVSEDPQDQAMLSLAEACTAAARGKPEDAVRRAREALAHADALGISFGNMRWAWPLAAHSAHELRDTVATAELLAVLDAYKPGHLAPMLRAERNLARARQAEGAGDQPAAAAFAAAVASLRENSTPYHLARPARPRRVPHPPRPPGRRHAGRRRSPRHRQPSALPAPAGPRRRPRPRTTRSGGLKILTERAVVPAPGHRPA
jgi:hypothetical protein